MIKEGIAQDNNPEDDPPGPFSSEEIRKRIAFNIEKLHLKGLGYKEILDFLEKYGQKGGLILLFIKIQY